MSTAKPSAMHIRKSRFASLIRMAMMKSERWRVRAERRESGGRWHDRAERGESRGRQYVRAERGESGVR
eukprot:CAMPEP_0198702466 /NCGR_PEP_ID=MMETSP1468-20131203/388778_1 /TAXON_ID=1461545 /ORGANISM="Mantoniella sp, Strain CCMP1436" /LENGTH=68 /DNA_ID=CAMNT_0044461005 /DNA_START=2261 /DNA_END=2467 /DNA_ORIENTATION=+